MVWNFNSSFFFLPIAIHSYTKQNPIRLVFGMDIFSAFYIMSSAISTDHVSYMRAYVTVWDPLWVSRKWFDPWKTEELFMLR